MDARPLNLCPPVFGAVRTRGTSWILEESEFQRQENEDQRLLTTTPLGIELQRPRPAQQTNNTAWSALGAFRGHPYPHISSPPSLPQIYVLRTFIWVIWKIQCFEKICRCWNRLDWRWCGIEGPLPLCLKTEGVFRRYGPRYQITSLAACVLIPRIST